jgi:hypothetical protein
LRVSWDLLRHVLRLPENCRLNAISTNVYFDLDQVAFRVECPDFPPTQEGCPLPVAAPSHSHYPAFAALMRQVETGTLKSKCFYTTWPQPAGVS